MKELSDEQTEKIIRFLEKGQNAKVLCEKNI